MIERVQQRWRDEPSGWWRTSVVLAGMALLLFLALAVTGVVLSRVYLPGVEPSAGAADALRTAHRVLSTLLFWTGFGLLVSGLGLAVQRHRTNPARRGGLLTGGLPLVALIAVIGASYTGYLIAWDQLALWAVTVGEDLNGIWGAAFDDGVRFVLIDGTEVSPGTYARWAIAHTIVVPLLVLSLGVALARNLTRRPPPDGFW